MPEKQVNLELVSSYVRMFDDEPTKVTEHDTIPEWQLKRRDWAVGVGYDWYVSEKNIWNGNAHVNFTYYIFSTKKNAE